MCCHLLVGEKKLEQKTLEQLVVFLRCLKSKSKEAEEIDEGQKEDPPTEGEVRSEIQPDNNKDTGVRSQSSVSKPKPAHLPWLKDRSWKYFIKFEEEFEELRGI